MLSDHVLKFTNQIKYFILFVLREGVGARDFSSALIQLQREDVVTTRQSGRKSSLSEDLVSVVKNNFCNYK